MIFSKKSFIFLSIFIITSTMALPQQDHPMQSKATGVVTLDNWQQNRAYGLRNIEKIFLNFIGVNAEHIRNLVVEKNYNIDKLSAVKALASHKALDSMVILRGNKIIYEHYANGMTPQSLHSCQSSTKTILNLLVGKAIKEGKLNLNDKVEKYIPDIGSGFKGQTIANVLAMNIKHEHDESLAYTKPTDLFKQDESSAGFISSKYTNLTRKQFITKIKAGNLDGTNTNRTNKYFYASINTDLGAWIVEKATGVSTQQAVRNILHAVGGENSVYMATDKVGFPIVMGGMIMSTRDFARYGMLLMNGGYGANGDMVGGGKSFVEDTIKNGKVSLGSKGWYYINSVYASKYGFGHPGWGGQWLWVDPQSKTVIAVFSGLMSRHPADPAYAKLLLNLAKEVVEYNRHLSS